MAGKYKARPAPFRWQVRLRLLATILNSAMVLYVYAAHLSGLNWQNFGRNRAAELGQSRSIRDYLTQWDQAFDHLRDFTFSEAMLENLMAYMVVGAPVAVALLIVERNRIRWLQSLVARGLSQTQAKRSSRLLELYLWMLSVTLMLIVLIGPLHLDLPRAHYACVAVAISCGVVSLLIYLSATADLAASGSISADKEVASWAASQPYVRFVLRSHLLLHTIVGLAAVWKAESLGDDWPALVFGIVETMLILGYQAWQAAFVLDDVVMLAGAPTGCPEEALLSQFAAARGTKAAPLALSASPVGKVGSSPAPWQVRLRLLATVTNSAMVLYVYAAHLSGLNWQNFGRNRAMELGQSRSIRDYFTEWDQAFDHLRDFTFSEAMLENLMVYMVIGAPVAVALFVVERNRIRWLQSLVTRGLSQAQAERSNRLLELYLWMISTTLMLIVMIGPLHLDLPRAHYACVACAISCGVVSLLIYLAATADLAAGGASAHKDVAAWAASQRCVRPVLKAHLLLHGVVGIAAAWKAESLGDDWPALVFGLLETLLILGYQAWLAVFLLDDTIMQRRSKAIEPKDADVGSQAFGNRRLEKLDRLLGS